MKASSFVKNDISLFISAARIIVEPNTKPAYDEPTSAIVER